MQTQDIGLRRKPGHVQLNGQKKAAGRKKARQAERAQALQLKADGLGISVQELERRNLQQVEAVRAKCPTIKGAGGPPAPEQLAAAAEYGDRRRSLRDW